MKNTPHHNIREEFFFSIYELSMKLAHGGDLRLCCVNEFQIEGIHLMF